MRKITVLVLFIMTIIPYMYGQDRVFTRTAQTTAQIRKYSELSFDVNSLNQIVIGADKYQFIKKTNTMLKTNRYDVDYLKPNMRYEQGYSLEYSSLRYIKNMQLFVEQSSNTNFIAGCGRQEMNFRETVLSKFNPTQFPNFDYKRFLFNLNGADINTGAVALKPILDDTKNQSGFQVALVKDFEITGGMIVLILDNELNVLKSNYIFDNNRDLSFNNIVQVQFPSSTITSDFASNAGNPSALTSIYDSYNNQISFAVIGTSIDKTLTNADAVAQQTNYEVVSTINGALNVISTMTSQGNRDYTKGTDLDYDVVGDVLYTLGHSSDRTFHISMFRLNSPSYILSPIDSREYFDLVTPSYLQSISLHAENIHQQINGNSIKFEDGKLMVVGYQEAYKGVNDKLSQVGHISFFDARLNPIHTKTYNTLYSFVFNRKSGTDYAQFNVISARIPFGELGPKLIVKDRSNSFGTNNMLFLFNSDKVSDDIKQSTIRIDLNSIPGTTGCMEYKPTYSNPFGMNYNNYSLSETSIVYTETVYTEKVFNPDFHYALCNPLNSPIGGGIGGGVGGGSIDPPPCPSDPYEDCDGADNDLGGNPTAGSDPTGEYNPDPNTEGAGDDGDNGSVGDGSRLAPPARTLTYGTIYPNPNNGSFSLLLEDAMTDDTEKASITLYNAQGQKVYQSTCEYQELANKSLDIKGLPAGIYYISVDRNTVAKYSGTLHILK